jgi:cytochrome c peroxidase
MNRFRVHMACVSFPSSLFRRRGFVGLLLVTGLGLWVGLQALEAGAAPSFYGTSFERRPSADELTRLGRALFFDQRLSASGRMACASCHDPAHAWGPPNDLSAQLGGPLRDQQGIRAVPSLMYRSATPSFSEQYYDTEGDDSVDQGPTGGFTWDGRANSVHEQAAIPLLAANEIWRLSQSPNAALFRDTFGPHALDDPDKAWNGLLLALEVFQQNPADFAPYSSKFDAFLRGQSTLTAQEARGLAAFNSPDKGNCASCHISTIRRGAFPRFTDDGLIALGAPRNRALKANADPRFFDLGACGPLRTDLADHPEDCGIFKTPSLRNVATRHAFFHNGVYHRLDEAVRFYALRDTRPAQVFGRDAKGHPRLHPDDLPAAYRDNLNTDPPFGQHPGDPLPFTEADVQDIVAFLKTLTDGYRPTRVAVAAPSAVPSSAP